MTAKRTCARARAVPRYPYKYFSDGYVKAALAEGKDWRAEGAVTECKSQGSQGTCGTFGQTQDAESQYFRGGGGANPDKAPHKLVQFSEQMLLSCKAREPSVFSKRSRGARSHMVFPPQECLLPQQRAITAAWMLPPPRRQTHDMIFSPGFSSSHMPQQRAVTAARCSRRRRADYRR